jgi:hypothetical protein
MCVGESVRERARTEETEPGGEGKQDAREEHLQTNIRVSG